MSSNKTYRIKANEGEEYVDLSLNLEQDIDIFEILSLKINSENFYRLHTSKYGCVAGRVLANNAIGVPNVKISIFIAADNGTKEDAVLSYLYPYSSPNDKNSDGVQYNLLNEEQINACHQNVGTFPSKRLVLDDNNVFEVFDKYYKFTTTTNSAGDYMIFGVPKGTQMLHMDVDLSDIGDLLSQTPRDFIYKGYDVNQFESPSQFKKSTELGSLPQIISQEESVFVYPFWGDPSEMGESDSTGVRISRKDITLNYNFEPTCVFFGSLITDEKSNGFSEKCVPTERMGKMDRLTTGEGTIEMIRKTPDGDVESFNVAGTHLIDGDGVWCYQIPMNLDFVKTDEMGNIVPTDNPNKGLPTRTCVRFRFSVNDFASDSQNNHLCKMLVPNNPHTLAELSDNAYAFGTLTPEHEFRDLLWNKVYSVKSYIPRLQKSDWDREKRFSGVKAVNVNASNNPVPYNNMRIDITFLFVMQCAIMHTLVWLAGTFNKILKELLTFIIDNVMSLIPYSSFKWNEMSCITIGDGACPDLEGWYFAPGCHIDDMMHNEEKVLNMFDNTIARIESRENGTDDSVDPESIDKKNKETESVCLTNKIDYFIQCVEMALAQEYEVIQFDFYNDWLNGVLYIPRWFASIKKKRTYLWGLVFTDAGVRGCMESTFNQTRRFTQQCALECNTAGTITTANGCVSGGIKQKCHKVKGRKHIDVFLKSTVKPGGGIVHNEQNISDNKFVYYFRPCDFKTDRIETRINYFLTDIILLGSLNEYDIDGVPQAFKGLVSSTYKMPTNLAATNMDIYGRMYGDNNYVKCGTPSSETTISKTSANTVNDNFESYSTWAQHTGWDTDNDANEYPLTESAGIDWGYTGPEQKVLESADGEEAGILFKPGGHFLAISCFNSESNVKSCVNLSRACEIDVSFSNRKELVTTRNDGRYLVLPPTGLISDDEINDGDFRQMFASLNSNGLKTVKNEKDGRYQYDFLPLVPVSFDGSFKSKIIQNDWVGYNIAAGSHLSTHYKTYYVTSRTKEANDTDYRRFRFGLSMSRNAGDLNTYVDKFGYRTWESSHGTRAVRFSLPMYENSYYFYFGLHDGATALDKFYEKFYAECYQYTNFMPRAYIEIVKTSPSGSICNGLSGGITANTFGISENTPWDIYIENAEEGALPIVTGTVQNSAITCTELLSAGTYFISASTVMASFEIIENDLAKLGVVELKIASNGTYSIKGYRHIVDSSDIIVIKFQVRRIDGADHGFTYNVTQGQYGVFAYTPTGALENGIYQVIYTYSCGGTVMEPKIAGTYNVTNSISD